MLTMSDYIDAFWDFGFRESDIAQIMQIPKRQVLNYRVGKMPELESVSRITETREATHLGWGGSMTCRRVKVTLPYSGTVPSAPAA